MPPKSVRSFGVTLTLHIFLLVSTVQLLVEQHMATNYFIIPWQSEKSLGSRTIGLPPVVSLMLCRQLKPLRQQRGTLRMDDVRCA